jgi:HD superfamily phosphohydrolase YqeK
MHLMEEDEKVADCLRIINELSTQPIVNLTGYSNTDLKLEYGTANITILTEYDQNYTLLASTLQQWADLLYKADYIEPTRQILEFAVSTRTDVSHSYDILAEIYIQNGSPDKIQGLMDTAETLNSLNREVIIRHLREKSDGSESCQSTGSSHSC